MPQFEYDAVIPMRKRMLCPECGANMKSKRGLTTTFKTDWLHECEGCTHEEWADHPYPSIVYLDPNKD